MKQETSLVIAERPKDARTIPRPPRHGARPAAGVLVVTGMALLCFVVAFVDGPTINPVVPLAGIAVASTGTLLYFLSPSRYLRDDVSDAVALSTVKTIGMALSSAPPGVRGTYLPAAQNGALQLFMPVSDDRRDVTTTRMGKGILLDPPGYDLLSYSRRIGASFSPEVLESSISDVMENGLELAGKVTVDREGDRVRVTMRDLANAGMCGEIRKSHPRLCTQAGCPICSFVACMIAEGTGRRVQIASADVSGKSLTTTFELS